MGAKDRHRGLALRGRGNADRFCERVCDGFFNRMMQRVKAIKTALVFIHQASYAPPFLAGKGAGGIGLKRRLKTGRLFCFFYDLQK